MGSVVILNVYDLSPANDCLHTIGFGLHHSGVEILGTEYSFASGGGIFESRPKDAQGAKFRESLELGSFEGGSVEIRKAIGELRSDFGPNAYNLITRNCNHFANALVYTLLRKPIPPYVNRLADIGSCMSCLLPKKMLEAAPVGDSSGFQASSAGSRAAAAKTTSSKSAFSGSGMALGASSSSSNSGGGIFGVLGGSGGSSSKKGNDDLTDRREKARKAALARFSGNS